MVGDDLSDLKGINNLGVPRVQRKKYASKGRNSMRGIVSVAIWMQYPQLQKNLEEV